VTSPAVRAAGVSPAVRAVTAVVRATAAAAPAVRGKVGQGGRTSSCSSSRVRVYTCSSGNGISCLGFRQGPRSVLLTCQGARTVWWLWQLCFGLYHCTPHHVGIVCARSSRWALWFGPSDSRQLHMLVSLVQTMGSLFAAVSFHVGK
jgi:hypothetical protein